MFRFAANDGITISRLRAGRIVEDWSAFDGVQLLRGLGPLRALLAAPRLLAAMRDACVRVQPGADATISM